MIEILTNAQRTPQFNSLKEFVEPIQQELERIIGPGFGRASFDGNTNRLKVGLPPCANHDSHNMLVALLILFSASPGTGSTNDPECVVGPGYDKKSVLIDIQRIGAAEAFLEYMRAIPSFKNTRWDIRIELTERDCVNIE